MQWPRYRSSRLSYPWRSFLPTLLSPRRSYAAQPTTVIRKPIGSSPFLPLPRSIAPRRGLLLLGIPVPPTLWPPKLELESKLLSAASQALKPQGIAVNAYYDGSGEERSLIGPAETFPAKLLFPDGKEFHYPSFNLAALSSSSLLSDAAYRPDENVSASPNQGRGAAASMEIFICTHGSRDCRCSDRGGPLVQALRREISKKGVENEVKVREIAHVGGHKCVLLLSSR